MRTFVFAMLAGLAGMVVAGAALAQSPAAGGPTPSAPGAEVYFVDLKDGATIGPKTTIHFGLRGMGVAPAGSDRPNTGHHHLLVDVELPPLDQPIPSDFNHLHFGAGQTEVDLSLAPGPHTLQLLLGDQNHIPHSPPVMSALIHVMVAETPPAAPAPVAQAAPAPAPAAAAPAVAAPDAQTRRPSAPGAKVSIESPADGATVPPTFTVRFGIANMTIAPAGVDTPNSGHHHLLIDTPLPPFDEPIPSDENHLHFGKGQTETTLTLPPGRHTLQLLLGDADHVPHDPPVYSAPITVLVSAAAARHACGAGEGPGATGACEPRRAARSHRLVEPRRADQPRFGGAPRRAFRAGPGEGNAPAARVPNNAPDFYDFRHCGPGAHSESFPNGQGYRCMPD